jgi:hypothetical protein
VSDSVPDEHLPGCVPVVRSYWPLSCGACDAPMYRVRQVGGNEFCPVWEYACSAWSAIQSEFTQHRKHHTGCSEG